MKPFFDESLHGKNTLETARILAGVFVGHFGEAWGNEDEIRNALVPRGKATTWGGLDRSINLFCKQFYDTWEADAGKVEFWDNARFLIGSLPMRREYTPNPDKKEYSDPQFVAEFFESCSLCWRSVLRKPLEKKTPLCHSHDLPSTHATYRRLARSKPLMERVKLNLLKTLPPLARLRQEQGIDLNTYLKDLCRNESGALPHLARYLHAQGLPLETGHEIIQALESPISQKISPIVREAWKYHMNERGERLRLAYLQILTAEAWLYADTARKHGGKRR